MGKNLWFLAGLTALLVMISACAAPSVSRLEMDYGTSVKLSRFNQIADPGAVKNLEAVAGLDGEAAKAIMDKYRKDFEKPSAQPVYMFNMGGIASK